MDIRQSHFSHTQVAESRQRLYGHIRKDHNVRDQIKSGSGLMSHDLSGAILHSAEFNDASWVTVDMDGLAANGSRWTTTDFIGCNVENASLQYCEFTSDVFLDCPITGANFSNSALFSCALSGASIRASSFVDSEFVDCILSNVNVSRSTFELCRIRDSVIEDIDFRNINLPYLYLDNVRLNNVNLPFMQVPYIYFGFQTLFDESNVAAIATHKGESVLTREEYRELIPDFIVYFADNNEFFPWANCLEAVGEHGLALERCLDGVRQSARARNYRAVYQLCLLATHVLKADRSRREEIVQITTDMAGDLQLSAAERFQFARYYPRIKQLAYDNPLDQLTLDITFRTNIQSDDYQGLALFMSFLDAIAEQSGATSRGCTVEVRHHSPFQFNWLPVVNLQQCIDVLHVLHPYAKGAIEAIGSAADFITVADLVSKAVGRVRRRHTQRKEGYARHMKSSKEGEPKSVDQILASRQVEICRLRDRLEEMERAKLARAEKLTPNGGQLHADDVEGILSQMRARGISIEDIRISVLGGGR